MFGEIFNSASDFVKTRVTNPLLGTIIFVWLIRNFDFVYALFNFPDNMSVDRRINYFWRYFHDHGYHYQFCNVAIALLLIVAAFVGLWVSRALANWYTNALNWLNNKSAKGQVVDRSELDSLNTIYDNVRIERNTLKSEAKLHDDQIKDFLKQIKESESNQEKIKNEKEVLDLSLKEAIAEAKMYENNSKDHLNQAEKAIKDIGVLQNKFDVQTETIVELKEGIRIKEVEMDLVKKHNRLFEIEGCSIPDDRQYIFDSFIRLFDGIHTLTISDEQLALIRKRFKAIWLPDFEYVFVKINEGYLSFPGNAKMYERISKFMELGLLKRSGLKRDAEDIITIISDSPITQFGEDLFHELIIKPLM